ncbi:hypothetical protein K1Y78_09010 [Streptomyces sp. tea 10]|nr:hypothetical protein [Streptomyces sp. tea 10]
MRQAILRGATAPARRQVETELAEQFGATRAGIRLALRPGWLSSPGHA